MAKSFSPSGEKFTDIHGYKVDEAGKKIFAVIGQSNNVERINVAGVGCSLYEMIEKFLKTGDTSFLSEKANALNVDLTSMPSNLIDLYMLKTTTVEDFSKFPVDYRALFNHNVDDYISAIKDGSVAEITEKFLSSKNKNQKLKDENKNE